MANGNCVLVNVADVREAPREGGTPTHELVTTDYDVDATYVPCDVTDLDDLETAVDAADAYGGVDVMVNNAGVIREGPFTEVTEDEFDRLMDVNVKGVFFGAQYAAEKMVGDGGGAIINMSSVAGLRGSANSATYSASKGAVRLLTYALAGELGPEGVRVNAIHPGVTETEMTHEDVETAAQDVDEHHADIPAERFGDPGDVADAACYLASDMADYVNGESLVVDGGMTYGG